MTRAPLPGMLVWRACDVSAFIVSFMPKDRSAAWLLYVAKGVKDHADSASICLLAINSRLFCIRDLPIEGLRSFHPIPLILLPDYVERICFLIYRQSDSLF
jgi:hypothetical protein